MELDIASTSAVVATVGVIIGFAFTYWQLRDMARTRRSELRWRILESVDSREFLEAAMRVMDIEYKDQKDFEEKYGLDLRIEMSMVLNVFDAVGELLRKGLADFDIVSSMPVVLMWEKMLPFVEGARKAANDPSWWQNFEYFYNETKRRQQRLASKAA